MRSLCLDKPVLPHGTYHGTHMLQTYAKHTPQKMTVQSISLQVHNSGSTQLLAF